MYISLDKIYYVYARARYIYLVTILRRSYVCGVQWSRVWRKSRFLEHSISRWQHASAWALERRYSSPFIGETSQKSLSERSQRDESFI